MRQNTSRGWTAALILGTLALICGVASVIVNVFAAVGADIGFAYVATPYIRFVEPVFVGTRLLIAGVASCFVGVALLSAWVGHRLTTQRWPAEIR